MNKPVKWGIKGFLICNSYNGYCYNIKLFYGKKTTPFSEKLSKSENIVLDFVIMVVFMILVVLLSTSIIIICALIYWMSSKNKIGCLGMAKKK